ncbi:hypothetical protein LAZ67_16000248 [Cordylochernes scorpioides]|uniref:Uncharacterized protein n=1 Tax=Cordylochernes scorpioides TaxID=51811 RepID=A0ABY6LCJ0_9ARAC|nr:hypothetical protein LAZ67_16000248 [Cordylochernes scorpioides]
MAQLVGIKNRYAKVPLYTVNLWEILRTDVLEKINLGDFLRNMVEDFRHDMPSGIGSLGVPPLDPFTPPDVNEDIKEDTAEARVIFSDIRVVGLSNFQLDRLDASLKYLFIDGQATFPEVKATARYLVDGKVAKIFPLRGNGTCWLQVNNATLGVHAALASSGPENRLSVSKDLRLDAQFDAMEGDFENLLGGGKWTEALKKMLFKASSGLFKLLYPKVKDNASSTFRDLLNQWLAQLPITSLNRIPITQDVTSVTQQLSLLIQLEPLVTQNVVPVTQDIAPVTQYVSIKPGSTANEYVDQLLANVRQMVDERGMDPAELPEYRNHFNRSVMMVTWTGEVHLWNGTLRGLKSLYRAGECEVDADETRVTIVVRLGLKDLKLHYDGLVKFMSMGPTIGGGGTVDTVTFYLRLSQSSLKGSSPVLEDFHIEDMSTVWVELTGMSLLSWLVKWLATGVAKVVETSIKETLSTQISEFIREQLKGVSFPIG